MCVILISLHSCLHPSSHPTQNVQTIVSCEYKRIISELLNLGIGAPDARVVEYERKCGECTQVEEKVLRDECAACAEVRRVGGLLGGRGL
jgi:hypothetical protein